MCACVCAPMHVRERQEDPGEVTAQVVCLSSAARRFTFVHLCLCLFKGLCTSGKGGSVSSLFACPGTSIWGQWDPGATTRQAECLCPTVGVIYLVIYMYVYVFPLTDPHPDQPDEERG